MFVYIQFTYIRCVMGTRDKKVGEESERAKKHGKKSLTFLITIILSLRINQLNPRLMHFSTNTSDSHSVVFCLSENTKTELFLVVPQ